MPHLQTIRLANCKTYFAWEFLLFCVCFESLRWLWFNFVIFAVWAFGVFPDISALFWLDLLFARVPSTHLTLSLVACLLNLRSHPPNISSSSLISSKFSSFSRDDQQHAKAGPFLVMPPLEWLEPHVALLIMFFSRQNAEQRIELTYVIVSVGLEFDHSSGNIK